MAAGIWWRCSCFDRIVGNIPFNHAGQATAGKTSAESSTAFSATVCTDMGGMTAAASRKVIAGKALKSAESPGRNHSLRQHRDDRAGCERQNGRGLSGRRAEQKVSRTGGDADK